MAQQANRHRPREQRQQHIAVVVLGDLGRSPRMQYHALSILQAGHKVSLIGYHGEDLIPDLQTSSSNSTTTANVTTRNLDVIRFGASSPKVLRSFLPLYYAWRLLSLVGGLVYALWIRLRRPADCVLVQNPPAVPLLLVAYVYCRILRLRGRSARFVIDWHNLGYTMFPKPGPVQTLAHWYERVMAPKADGHLCVTAAMKEFLIRDMKVPHKTICVLYDCPPAMFRPLTVDEQHDFLMRIHHQLIQACPSFWYRGLDLEWQTLFTEEADATVSRAKRPLLITSSTSWTEDEDFDLLLDAMVRFEEKLESISSATRVLVVITGKGPLKEMYEAKMSRLSLRHVAFQTLWLQPGDYPRILACADLGISLHTSTSGLDLPMKVLDLYGCQTPVCALDFACLSELVQDGWNGHVFRTSQQLADQLYDLSKDKPARAPPHEYGKLKEYSNNLANRKRWSENWQENAAATILPP